MYLFYLFISYHPKTIHIYIYIRIYIYIIYIYIYLFCEKCTCCDTLVKPIHFLAGAKGWAKGDGEVSNAIMNVAVTCMIQKGWSRTVAGASTTAQPSFWPEAQKQNSPDIVVNLLASVYCTDCASSANLKLKFLCAKSVLHRSRFPEGFLRMCSDHTTQ